MVQYSYMSFTPPRLTIFPGFLPLSHLDSLFMRSCLSAASRLIPSPKTAPLLRLLLCIQRATRGKTPVAYTKLVRRAMSETHPFRAGKPIAYPAGASGHQLGSITPRFEGPFTRKALISSYKISRQISILTFTWKSLFS